MAVWRNEQTPAYRLPWLDTWMFNIEFDQLDLLVPGRGLLGGAGRRLI